MEFCDFEAWLLRFSPETAQHLKRKKRWKLIKLLMIEAILIGLLIASLSAFVDAPYASVVYLLFGVLALAVPFLLPPRGLLVTRGYLGTIVEMHTDAAYTMKRGSGAYKSDTGMEHALQNRVFVWYVVRDTNGKMHTVVLESKYHACFSIGDRIAVVTGLEYPINLENRTEGNYLCPVCGSIMATPQKPTCLFCGTDFERAERF